MTLSVSDVRAVASNVFLFGLVLGMAGTIEPKAFEKRVREYRGLVMGLASQFVLLPFLGFLVVRSFKLDAVAGITLLITTTSPGGGFSGLLCSLCNADLALSVAMTTVSTVMAMFLIPLNCLIYINSLYGVSVQLPWASLCLSVSVVVAAVAVGLALSAKRPGWSSGLNRIGTACGLANIALAGLSSGGSDTPFWSHPPLFVLAIGLPCLAGLLCSFVISRHVLRIDGPQAVAICIECCYQNTALAVRAAGRARALARRTGVPARPRACAGRGVASLRAHAARALTGPSAAPGHCTRPSARSPSRSPSSATTRATRRASRSFTARSSRSSSRPSACSRGRRAGRMATAGCLSRSGCSTTTSQWLKRITRRTRATCRQARTTPPARAPPRGRRRARGESRTSRGRAAQLTTAGRAPMPA